MTDMRATDDDRVSLYPDRMMIQATRILDTWHLTVADVPTLAIRCANLQSASALVGDALGRSERDFYVEPRPEDKALAFKEMFQHHMPEMSDGRAWESSISILRALGYCICDFEENV